MNDQAIAALIARETQRQTEGLELIASENYVSADVLAATGSIFTNKYAEGYPKRRYYNGCEVVDEVEELAIERLKKIFGCAYANVQPHSGSQANAALLSAVMRPGEAFLGLDLSMGGHLTHGAPVSMSGQIYKAHFYRLTPDTHVIDYNHLLQTARSVRPKIIICGASAYSRDWDYARFRSIADEVGAFLWCDMAHTAGLIAAQLLNNPFEHCHFITSTTHKTLRGPRGGIILMPRDFENRRGEKDNKGQLKMMSQLINLAVFPGHQGGPLEHIIAAKAVAFNEVLDPSFKDYARQVIANAQALSQALSDKEYSIISGGTDTHLLLIDLRNKHLTGKKAAEVLDRAGITVNKNMIPYDPSTPFVTSGIRLGTAAITTRGLRPKEMPAIADFIDQALNNAEDAHLLLQIKKRIKAMLQPYPLFSC